MDTSHLVREIFPLFRALRHIGDLKVEPSRRTNGPHVVILPGYGAVPHLYWELKRSLEKRGFRAHLADVGVNIHTLPKSLEIVERETRKLVGKEPFQFVGHSLGGGVAAGVLALTKLKGQIRQVIALGTPFLGCPFLPLRRLVIATTGISEITFLENRAAFLAVSDRITSVSSEEDQIAPPERCIIPESKMTRFVFEKKLGIGHAHMMGGYPAVNRLVAELLEKNPSF